MNAETYSTAVPEPPPSPRQEAGRASVVYLGGCGRSGSTLLDRIIGQVAGHLSAGELVHLWRRGLAEDELCGCGLPFSRCPFWRRVGREAFGGWDRIESTRMLALARRVDRNRYIPFMLLPLLWPPYRSRLREYIGILERLYEAIAVVGEGAVIVDSSKHASYAFLLRRIKRLDLQVVHLVRDSRGVAYSQGKRVQRPEVVGSAAYMPTLRPERSAAQWLSNNLLFHLLKATGTPTSFLRYEALVAEPRAEVERILRQTGDVVRPSDLDFIQGSRVSLEGNHTVAGNPMRFRGGELVVRPDERWRNAMNGRDRAVTSLLTWPLRMAYGYSAFHRWAASPTSPQMVNSAPTAWPSVSVIVATRQRPELLRRAVRTILDQGYGGDLELLIVFDQGQPTDLGLPVPMGRHIRTLTNERTPGLAGARNTGILAATGELVAFCDDDDEWLPGKLETQVRALLGTPQAAVAATGIEVVYDKRVTTRIPPAREIGLRRLLRSRIMELHPSTVVARRRNVLEEIGLIDEHIPGSYGEDYEWLLRVARRGPILAVQRPLARVHWHQSSYFADRWTVIIDAIEYLLQRYPEFRTEPRGLARLYGRKAFAHAAAGHDREARVWAYRCLRLNWRERRAFVALAVSSGIVSADSVLRFAHRMGRGI